MGLDVDAVDGALRGVVLASGKTARAFADSPELRVDIQPDDRDHLVFRLAYFGACELGMVSLERNAAEPATNPGTRRERQTLFDPVQIPFQLHAADNEPHLYHIPIYQHVRGAIHRVRFHPCVSPTAQTSGQTFVLDWIAFVKAPVIAKVRGCIDQYFTALTDLEPRCNCSDRETLTNDFLASYTRECDPMPDMPVASTYNCARSGGEVLSISGRHFGVSDAIVTIDGVECQDVVHVEPEVELQCRLPPASSDWRMHQAFPSRVRVQLGALPEIFDDVTRLAFAAPVRTPLAPPVLSNVAAHALDVNWKAPASLWDAMTVTGYRIAWKPCSAAMFAPENVVTVGNVTTTTLLGLDANTSLHVKVAPMTEDQRDARAWQSIDLYGRRAALPSAVIGVESSLSACVSTLATDFNFPRFSAQALTNQSVPVTAPTLGPTGEIGDQGQVGLYVNGDAHVENANASVSCCDGFDPAARVPTASCAFVAASTTDARVLQYDNNVALHSVPTNAAFAVPFAAKQVYDAAQPLQSDRMASAPVTAACGPALRLTGSRPQLAGSAWFPRQMNVREGFDTTFTLRLANPSTTCAIMDHVHSRCRSRGGDGLAFVVQNDNAIALGAGGMSLGFGGLRRALAVEFDSFFNAEQQDAFENHVSVLVSGPDDSGGVLRANHSHALGTTTAVPDLTQATHRVRIVYSPNLDAQSEAIVFSEAFAASAVAGDLFASGAWSTGVGLLAVYVDDLESPALAVPLRIERTLELFHGRAWVGFTAATGATAWQTHDILDWQFASSRTDVRTFEARSEV